MKKYLFIFIFVSIAQLFYGQEKYTIQGELPDHSLDNSYLRLTNSSALSQEKERIKHLLIVYWWLTGNSIMKVYFHKSHSWRIFIVQGQKERCWISACIL